MNDTMIVTFRLDHDLVPDGSGQLGFSKLSALHSKEFLEAHGEGWTAVSHQILPVGGTTLALTVMLVREINLTVQFGDDSVVDPTEGAQP